jgi:predicted nucleic acid-binding protein
MIYLDTSALIKRYIWESGSEQVRRVLRESGVIVTSKIAYAEVYAAFTRRMREGDLVPIRYRQVCRLFEREWRAYLIVEVHDEILHLSRDLIKRYPLRGFDALHLASAKSLGQQLRTTLTFGCADQRLLESAKAERFELLAV